MIADQFDTFLFDLDGVVCVGDAPVPGAPTALALLRQQGKTLRFLTNDPPAQPTAVLTALSGLFDPRDSGL